MKSTPETSSLVEWLAIARGLLEQPTAALREESPQCYVRQFAAARPALQLTADSAGNLLVRYSSRGSSRRPPLVLVAHLDHPGFHIKHRSAGILPASLRRQDSCSPKIVELEFEGGVGCDHALPGTPVAFYARNVREAVGRGELIEATGKGRALKRASARITSGEAPVDGFAMWDLPPFTVRNGVIISRCCDDLLGASAALCTLHEIARRRPRGVELWSLFTRAEEIGFLGTLEAIRLGTVPKNACVLSLECSKALPNAPQGAGVIVRVGDRASIFDPGLSAALRSAAEQVAKSDSTFKHQRKLMDGGSCEATAFCAHGYRASGLAVPLGNYHNMAQGVDARAEIGPESVHVDDFRCEVQLLIQLALNPQLLDSQKSLGPPWLKELKKKARQKLHPRGRKCER